MDSIELIDCIDLSLEDICSIVVEFDLFCSDEVSLKDDFSEND